MTDESRLISAENQKGDDVLDRAMRPIKLKDYVGQPAVIEQMEIFIQAARKRQDALDHVLIFGPPGLGKTTLSHIIANELDVDLKVTQLPPARANAWNVAYFTKLECNRVLSVVSGQPSTGRSSDRILNGQVLRIALDAGGHELRG